MVEAAAGADGGAGVAVDRAAADVLDVAPGLYHQLLARPQNRDPADEPPVAARRLHPGQPVTKALGFMRSKF